MFYKTVCWINRVNYFIVTKKNQKISAHEHFLTQKTIPLSSTPTFTFDSAWIFFDKGEFFLNHTLLFSVLSKISGTPKPCLNLPLDPRENIPSLPTFLLLFLVEEICFLGFNMNMSVSYEKCSRDFLCWKNCQTNCKFACDWLVEKEEKKSFKLKVICGVICLTWDIQPIYFHVSCYFWYYYYYYYFHISCYFNLFLLNVLLLVIY